MTTRADLHALRVCTFVNGYLHLAISDSSATQQHYEVFSALEEIKGMHLSRDGTHRIADW